MIKNCPFCGSDAEIDNFNPDKKQYVVCCNNENCFMFIGWDLDGLNIAKQTEKEAIKAWNTRVSPWIRCKERLPEERKRVLVTNKQGYVRITTYSNQSFHVPEMIIAWMPIPEFEGE